jgi:hypothetical protein
LFLTQRFFSELKATSGCAALILAGISFYFLLPVFSMTNPPINWGYPRTVEGFFHILSRGQFPPIEPTDSFNRLMMQWKIYCEIAVYKFGLIYLIAAVIPFFLLHKVSSPVRRWLAGLLAVWFFASLFMLVGLNADKSSAGLVSPFFAATHLILAMFAGCGLMLFVAILGRPIPAKS